MTSENIEAYYNNCCAENALILNGSSPFQNDGMTMLTDSRGKIKYSESDKFIYIKCKQKPNNNYEYWFQRKCEDNDKVFYQIELTRQINCDIKKSYDFKTLEKMVLTAARTNMEAFGGNYREVHKHLFR